MTTTSPSETRHSSEEYERGNITPDSKESKRNNAGEWFFEQDEEDFLQVEHQITPERVTPVIIQPDLENTNPDLSRNSPFQYAGKIFAKPDGSTFYISEDGRIDGKAGLEGASIEQIAGLNTYQARMFNKYMPSEGRLNLEHIQAFKTELNQILQLHGQPIIEYHGEIDNKSIKLYDKQGNLKPKWVDKCWNVALTLKDEDALKYQRVGVLIGRIKKIL